MAYIHRTECVFCKGKLLHFFTRDNFPITASPPETTQPSEKDIFGKQTFCICEVCSCVQLESLIDPEILYISSHNNTSHTPTWKEHHSMFKEFIGRPNDILFEIGGTGALYNLIKVAYPTVQYEILDICDPYEPIDDVTYYKGNCEEFIFPKGRTLILSHVFEHLYNPRKFVESVSTSQIDTIYISIPNMLKFVELGTSNILHNEHTFYVDASYTQWLFAQYEYSLVKSYEFTTHSVFLQFMKRSNQHTQDISLHRTEISEKIYTLWTNDTHRLTNINIQPGSFICPGGLFGQLLVYYAKPTHIRGFLDNDTSKQNLRVYGTPYYVFPFSELSNYTTTPVTIYILAGPYSNEIKKQILSYNSEIAVIEL